MSKYKFKIYNNDTRMYDDSRNYVMGECGELFYLSINNTLVELGLKFEARLYTCHKDCHGDKIYDGDTVWMYHSRGISEGVASMSGINYIRLPNNAKGGEAHSWYHGDSISWSLQPPVKKLTLGDLVRGETYRYVDKGYDNDLEYQVFDNDVLYTEEDLSHEVVRVKVTVEEIE